MHVTRQAHTSCLLQSRRTCEACRDSMTVCSEAQLSAGEPVDSRWAAPSLGCSRLTNRAASRGVASQRPSCRGLTKAHVGFCRQDVYSWGLCRSLIEAPVASLTTQTWTRAAGAGSSEASACACSF